MISKRLEKFFGNSFSDEELLQILINIYEHIDGHQISSKYRQENNEEDKSLTYGEIKFSGFKEIINLCGSDEGKVFYDIGSGTGKPSLAAALMFDFDKIKGIEYIPGLYEKSLDARDELANLVKPEYRSDIFDLIEFSQGDALKEDFSDGDIIFCNSTCFSMEFYEELIKKFLDLKKGTHVINLTKSFNSPAFELIFESKEIEFSWGKPTTRIYKKIS